MKNTYASRTTITTALTTLAHSSSSPVVGPSRSRTRPGNCSPTRMNRMALMRKTRVDQTPVVCIRVVAVVSSAECQPM